MAFIVVSPSEETIRGRRNIEESRYIHVCEKEPKMPCGMMTAIPVLATVSMRAIRQDSPYRHADRRTIERLQIVLWIRRQVGVRQFLDRSFGL